MKPNTLYALDFDGVICHSSVETAITAWKAAQGLWPDMQGQEISEKQIQQFCQIRPCLEFGSEAILIDRLLHQGVAMSAACEGYQQQLQSLIDEQGLDRGDLQIRFGETRDHEIEHDEAVWISNNPLFSGVADKLKRFSQDDWVIVTTKQERFVKHILQANGIKLDATRIFGLERKLNKQQTLCRLQDQYPQRPISFIEDRLPTLLGVQLNPQLQDINLQLVDWGYNTNAERQMAVEKGIEVIGKDSFLQAF